MSQSQSFHYSLFSYYFLTLVRPFRRTSRLLCSARPALLFLLVSSVPGNFSDGGVIGGLFEKHPRWHRGIHLCRLESLLKGIQISNFAQPACSRVAIVQGVGHPAYKLRSSLTEQQGRLYEGCYNQDRYLRHSGGWDEEYIGRRIERCVI